ncbi:MAG TPA: hypothetical protein VHN98_04705 [Acidimicrobiales bacterium]|nr:hypothetical protein [Acidimicrobiales bacterium]
MEAARIGLVADAGDRVVADVLVGPRLSSDAMPVRRPRVPADDVVMTAGAGAGVVAGAGAIAGEGEGEAAGTEARITCRVDADDPIERRDAADDRAPVTHPGAETTPVSMAALGPAEVSRARAGLGATVTVTGLPAAGAGAASTIVGSGEPSEWRSEEVVTPAITATPVAATAATAVTGSSSRSSERGAALTARPSPVRRPPAWRAAFRPNHTHKSSRYALDSPLFVNRPARGGHRAKRATVST